jgi:phosphatidate phosphatase PAH1
MMQSQRAKLTKMLQKNKIKLTKLFKKANAKAHCADIIFVEQKDGTLKSTPFFLQFPKRNQPEKEISISINDQLLSFKMCLPTKKISPFFLNNECDQTLPMLPKLKWRDWFFQPKNKFRFVFLE